MSIPPKGDAADPVPVPVPDVPAEGNAPNNPGNPVDAVPVVPIQCHF